MRLPLPVAAPALPRGRTRTDERLEAILAADRAACRTRSGRCLAVSFGAHVLLLLALLLLPRALPGAPVLTEFTMLEPGDLEAGPDAASAPARAAATQAGTATAAMEDESFRRTSPMAEVEPHPQVEDVFADRIASRLATLQSASAARVVGVAETRNPGTGTTIATAPATGGGGGATMSLNRGGTLGSGPPLSLTRGGGGAGTAPALATAPPAATRSATEAPATAGATSARRTLSGASLAGPIADRPVLSYRRPVYPDWAKRDLVGGTVTLYFIVRPDGSVKENILVQQTAGFEDFDENARAALRAWRFAPLTGGRTGEQWGTITFHYRLQEAG